MKSFYKLIPAFLVMLVFLAGCSSPEEKKQVFLDRGTLLYNQAEYTNARLEFKNALQIDPDLAHAWYMLGMTELKADNPVGAFQALNRAATLDPSDTRAHLELGRLYLASNAPEDALKKAVTVLNLSPGDPDAILMSASAFILRGDLEPAKKLLEKHTEITRADTYLLLNQIHRAQNEFKDAERVLKKGIEKNPDALSLHITLADLYETTGRHADAAEQMETVSRLDPADTAHRFNLASIYWDLGEKKKAGKIIGETIRSDPGNIDNIITQAHFYIEKKDTGKALELLEDATATYPANLPLHNTLACTYAGLGMKNKAVRTLETAVSNQEDKKGALATRNALAGLYLDTGRTEKAGLVVDRILDETPANTDAHFTKGRICLLENDYTGATTEFRTVIHDRPDMEKARILLARAHFSAGEKALALGTLKTALESIPDSYDIKLTLARMHLSLEQPVQAMKLVNTLPESSETLMAKASALELTGHDPAPAYRRIIDNDPGCWPALNNLAYKLARSGRLDEALTLATKADSLHPDDPAILDTLALIHQRKGDKKRAEELLERALEIAPENIEIKNHSQGM